MPTTRRPAGNSGRVALIGGGASGLAAACVLAQAGVPATVLEKEPRPGRKLLATGNGRCNLMNAGEPVYFGDAAFARAVLSHCDGKDAAAFFEGIGLALREEEGGRVYPATGHAASGLDCLLAQIARGPVDILPGRAVTGIRPEAGGFTLALEGGETMRASRVLCAGGSPAAPRLGGSGALADIVSGLGHPAVPFRPALCALLTRKADVRDLSGLRVPAYLTLYHGDAPVCASAGEALFTDDGLSGVCAMQLARDAVLGLEGGAAVSVSVNFAPLLGLGEPLMRRLAPGEADAKDTLVKARALLRGRRARLGEDRLFTGVLPPKLERLFAGMPPDAAAARLSDFRLPVLGVRGFDGAQAASGGLSCASFRPDTLESRRVPGLYALGEMVDVDGDTGGYNLMFAWACGILAARHAAGAALP
ncbi:MAG TPA: aminoacetone oxidase family FAD-binding enzyme [Candidatus Limnocylindria bacterium]|nr:aminoacetone oxidase family FAD-binding enzyme [Candidatus Limnocylindria bacterium]